MTSSPRFEGKHVVVTGAGTGIGRAIAIRLADEGARLTLFARDAVRLGDTAAKLPASAKAHVASLDIRDRAAVDGCFAAAAEHHGPIFGLVANAGIGGENRPGPEDRFDDLIATNLTGTYNCVRAAERHLEQGPEARHLLIVASILARLGVPGYTGYCASKAGLVGLARSLAAELAPQNIQVNAVLPGWVDTEMARQGIQGMAEGMGVTYDQAYEMAMSAVPMHRMSRAEDIAGMVAWLLSPDARGVTGQGLDMNGGAFMI